MNIEQIKIIFPELQGHYIIGRGMSPVLDFEKKPKFIHRLFCKYFLGWRWEDSPSLKEYMMVKKAHKKDLPLFLHSLKTEEAKRLLLKRLQR